jgi:hypothetical protein
MMYRQGDVLLVKVDNLPKAAVEVALDNKVVITLAYGEATGHHHSFFGGALMFRANEGEGGVATYVEVKPGAKLEHQEHSTITPAAGFYQVIIQREYSPEAIRNVQD